MTISQDITEQVAQCCVNIADAAEQAGSNLDQVVRVNDVLPDGSLFERCRPTMRAAFASARPEAMVIGAGLSSPAMNIEVTALKGSDAQFSGAPSSPGEKAPDRGTPLGRKPLEAAKIGARGYRGPAFPVYRRERARPPIAPRAKQGVAGPVVGRPRAALSPLTHSTDSLAHPLHPPTRSATDPVRHRPAGTVSDDAPRYPRLVHESSAQPTRCWATVRDRLWNDLPVTHCP